MRGSGIRVKKHFGNTLRYVDKKNASERKMKSSKKSKIKKNKINNDVLNHKSKNKFKKPQKNTDNWTLERKLISNELTKVKDIKYCYLSDLEDDLYLSIVKHNQNIRTKSFVKSLKSNYLLLPRCSFFFSENFPWFSRSIRVSRMVSVLLKIFCYSDSTIKIYLTYQYPNFQKKKKDDRTF